MKIHLACDANGLPLHFEITPGQGHENTSLIDTFSAAQMNK